MNLLSLRKQKGWSQEFISRHLEVSRATIVNWERGETEPTVSQIKKLAEMFQVSVDELLNS